METTTVRLHIYREFLQRAAPPSVGETAAALGIPEDQAAAAYRALADGHYIVLEPGTLDIWMANPLSARPTDFRVRTGDGREYYGSCVWDAPGVLAMLRTDGTVTTVCHDCSEPLTMEVRDGNLEATGVAHFSVPASKWWEDIGFS